MELPGVEEVYASSGFRFVEVKYDETKLAPDKIEATLEEAGYLGELPVVVEQSTVEERENGAKPYFRHTVAYAQTGQAVNFAQKVPYAGRPLWPCPGMGPIVQPKAETEEELNHG
jgi:hypothetical protein